MNLVRFAHRHRKAVLFCVVMLVFWGTRAALLLPISLFPQVTFPRIVMLAENGEQPIERTMVEVTRPLEEAARGVADVVSVRSKTSRGSSEISLSLAWGADVYRAMQLLQGRVAAAQAQMPAAVEVQIERMDVSVFPILGYSLTSERRSGAELRDLALYTLRPELLRVAGVARVDVAGGASREFQVIVDPLRLAAHDLDTRDVVAAIEAANLQGAAGFVADNYQLYLTVVDNALTGLDDVGEVVVATRSGTAIRVRDVAALRAGEADVYTRTSSNGRDAVLIDICRQPDGNTVRIGRDVQAALEELRSRLPSDVRIEEYMDQGEFIAAAIAGTRDAIWIGVGLAMLVLLLFLRSGRIMFVAALVVPSTIAATLACLQAVGQTINIMTLGGIAAAVGLVIDDVIVVVESIFHHFRQGESGIVAAREAVAELGPAIVGSSLATLVIHIPFAFLGGITGKFFAALSITMVLALTISFAFSVMLVPLVADALLRQRDLDRAVAREKRASALSLGYERILVRLLRRRAWVVPALAALMAGTVILYPHVGSGFLPDMDEGTFVLDYLTPPGTSLQETNRMLAGVETILRATPEVENYGRRTGAQLGFFVTEPNNGDILVKLRHDRHRSVFAVIDTVRAQIEATQPAMEIEFGQQMQDVIGDLIDNPAPIEIKVFGDDARQIEPVARQIAAVIGTVRGVEDVFDGITISGPSVNVHVDLARAARAGLTVRDVEEQLTVATRGSGETAVVRGEKLIGVRTRYADLQRQDLGTLRATLLHAPGGVMVPLDAVAAVATTPGQAEVQRENLRRMVSVTARISGRDLGSTVREIQGTVRNRVPLPHDVSLVYGGTFRSQQESFAGLLRVLLSAMLFVIIVLLFEFESLRVPLTIFGVNLPALFGVVAALWLTHTTFNISSFVGTILVVGIVAENAIFLMHVVRREQRQGALLDAAIIAACHERARPILMTTFAAVLALLPLALGLGTGASIQQSLAIAVIGGFSVSTLLLLFALPMLWGLVGDPSLTLQVPRSPADGA